MNRKKDEKKIIDFNKPPYWYTKYSWSPVPDNAQYFFGREIELKGFWYEMISLVGRGKGQKSNYAFIGQRKLGKTAYLKRCYNIAFWEQDEVVPFYYSFSQNYGEDRYVIQMSDLKKTMPVEFLKQFFAYCSRDKTFLTLDTCENMIKYAKETKFPKINGSVNLVDCIESCLNKIENNEDNFMMQCIWQMTQDLSFFMGKKCLLIIDEAQEMEISVYEGDECRPCKASISDIIQKQHSLVFISGSNVSMLVNNFLDYSVANRFSRKDFTPLREKDAKKLIEELCPNGYQSLPEDLVTLVGGNPYYIEKMLYYNMNYCEIYGEDKDFSTPTGLRKVYDFEVLHPKGEIYYFWDAHLRKNKQDLNRDPKGKKGLALQILYKISKNPGREFNFRDLAKEFNVKEDVVEAKIEQLVHADLIQPTGAALFALAFPDKVLPVIINQLYHHLIIEGPSKSVAEEALREYINRVDVCNENVANLEKELDKANDKLARIKKKFFNMNFALVNLDKRTNAALGKMNLRKGMRKENKIRKKVRMMIAKQQHMFSDYVLEGKVHSINISSSKGTGCQIDLFALLRDKNKKKSFALIAEIKNLKTKIGISDARKFVASLKRAKKEYKLKNIVAAYISVSGFTKGAAKYLDNCNIKMARSEEVFIE